MGNPSSSQLSKIASRCADFARFFHAMQVCWSARFTGERPRNVISRTWRISKTNHRIGIKRGLSYCGSKKLRHQLIDGLSQYVQGFNMFQPSTVDYHIFLLIKWSPSDSPARWRWVLQSRNFMRSRIQKRPYGWNHHVASNPCQPGGIFVFIFEISSILFPISLAFWKYFLQC